MSNPTPLHPNQVQPNPVQYPLPAPLPRRRSFAGPVVLIVIGIVFLLGNLHMLSWLRLGTMFAHYWPALLILWGVIKLVEYQQAQRDGVPARGIGAGGVFLVIFIVVCGLMATQAARFNWGELRDNMNIDDNDLNNIFGETYNFDDHLEQDLPAGATSLRVNDDHGAVRVSTSTDNKISVSVRKHVGAENQGDADKYDGETKPTITTIGGLVSVAASPAAVIPFDFEGVSGDVRSSSRLIQPLPDYQPRNTTPTRMRVPTTTSRIPRERFSDRVVVPVNPARCRQSPYSN